MRRALSRALFVAAAVFGAFACSVTYVPEPVRHDLPLAADAFARVVEAVRLRYPRLPTVDAVAWRIQSEWLPYQRDTVPGHRRATVFRDDAGRLHVVVEVRYLMLDRDGLPYTTPITGDLAGEQELAGAIEQVLAVG